ncbi:hypothetical protein KBZ10_08355 [Streptomyces sp. F63]|uniref:streptophobe family protein n=1 Tax=Streptomyces sp. F63 TaxID=2824887 RepID=UPI001B36349D|nr:streptophobe family protein [Streptomyces sp. F63]MBQ0984530.1 hypothetical protein [Streptomyces sp. F63]
MVRLTGPWGNFLEGAAAALYAVAAMVAVSALALTLLDAGSVGSLWSLALAVTAMAVGGSVSVRSDVSTGAGADAMGGMAALFGGGGGGMGPSVSGAAGVVPLGVTLAGAVVLWTAFSWRLRHRRQLRFTAGELVLRAGGTVTAALLALVIVAALARGSIDLPASATTLLTGTGGGASAGDTGAGGGGLGDLLGGGSGGPSGLLGGAEPAMTYRVSTGSAGIGALLWTAVVIGTGCLISRRARLPLGGPLDRLRTVWGGSLSALVRTALVLAVVLAVIGAVVGAVASGRGGSAAGAALLLAPNALAVFLSLGVGSPWTAAVHPVQSGGGGNPLAEALLGGMGGTGGGQPDRTEHLRSLSAGGWPLWFAALAVTGLILLACAHRAARAAHRGSGPSLPPFSQRGFSGHLGMAGRFGAVTAVVLSTGAWVAGASGHFGISAFGSEMGGTQAGLSGGVLLTVVFGLLAGTLAGFAGSLLAAVRGDRGKREEVTAGRG